MHIPLVVPRAVRSIWKRQSAPGALPGTLHVDPTAPKPVITVMAFGPDAYVERTVADPKELREFLPEWPVTWVNVEGLGDAEIIRSLGEVFDLHGLALEDVVNVHQRPKVDEYPDHLFIVARMIYMNAHIESEQISIFLGPNFVLTFQSFVGGDCLNPLRDRIRRGVGRIRQAGADYLAYGILDGVIDAYFPVLEIYSSELDKLETEVINNAVPHTVARIQRVKRNLLTLRRVIWPLREAVNMLIREPSPLITHDTQIFLRDCYDHTIQIMDLLETHRELAAGLMDVYLSSVSNRMNEIMKVLTIIATIFIPLSFIAGVYGMNFNPEASPLNMPELNWFLGYPFAWAIMLTTAGSLLTYFWRKGWLSSSLKEDPPKPEEQALEIPDDDEQE
jgi:magnesium transporter